MLANGLVRVEIDRPTGTFALDGLGGYGRLVDGGDLGDSYNYSPPRPGLLRRHATARWRCWSASGDPSGPGPGSPRPTPGPTTWTAPPRRGWASTRSRWRPTSRCGPTSGTVRVTTSFVNPSGDHRLRVHLPLPEPAAESHAESAFTVVTRGLTAEGRVRRVRAPDRAGAAFRDGRAADRGARGRLRVRADRHRRRRRRSTIALTVFRSTGMLSRLGMAYRPFPAGPMTPVEGLQMRGKRVTLRYALALDCDDPYALADDVLLPLETTPSLGGGTRPASGSELTVDGAEVSALHRVGGRARAARRSTRRPQATDGVASGPLRLAGRPARLSARAVRGLVRATTLRYRHRPAARRLTPRPGWRSTTARRRRAAPRGRAGPR